VWTSLHAQAWGDMSFFSVPTRHGDPSMTYPAKDIPRRMSMLLLELGVVANALALCGAMAMSGRREAVPMLTFVLVSAGAYLWWMLPQTSWAIKTKYLLFLLPVFVVFLVAGLDWLGRRVPAVGLAALVACLALVVVAHLYDLAFAIG
jgi:hypothetical protein